MPRKYKDHFARLIAAQSVCDIISNGTVTKKACIQSGVAFSTFVSWVNKYDDIADMWHTARSLLLESWSDDIIEIAEDGEFSYKDRNNELRIDTGAVNLAKLQIDSRKWLLSKLRPEQYGDKLQHKNDPDNPINGTVVVISSEHDVNI